MCEVQPLSSVLEADVPRLPPPLSIFHASSATPHPHSSPRLRAPSTYLFLCSLAPGHPLNRLQFILFFLFSVEVNESVLTIKGWKHLLISIKWVQSDWCGGRFPCLEIPAALPVPPLSTSIFLSSQWLHLYKIIIISIYNPLPKKKLPHFSD